AAGAASSSTSWTRACGGVPRHKPALTGGAACRYADAMARRDLIAEKLTKAFAPASLDVVDESHQHAGHAGHREGGETHFRVYIVAEAFRGKSRLERHRMINETLVGELASGVHALAIHASAPGESSPWHLRVAFTKAAGIPSPRMPAWMVMKPQPRCSLSRLEHRLAHQRGDAQRRDAVPVATQHPKTEAVEGEGLAGLGDRPRLVDDEPGDGGRFVVGQVPFHGAVEIADWNAAVDVDRAIGLRPYARHRDVVLIRDVADDFLQN